MRWVESDLGVAGAWGEQLCTLTEKGLDTWSTNFRRVLECRARCSCWPSCNVYIVLDSKRDAVEGSWTLCLGAFNFPAGFGAVMQGSAQLAEAELACLCKLEEGFR